MGANEGSSGVMMGAMGYAPRLMGYAHVNEMALLLT